MTNDPKPEVLAKILTGLAMGLPRDQAASAAFVSPGTLKRWMLEFEGVYEQIVQAEIALDTSHLTNLNTMALDDDTPKSVRANISEWMLEHHSPATWGKASRNDMWLVEQQVKGMIEDMRREGYAEDQIPSEQQVMKDLMAEKRKSLPSGKAP